MIATKLAFYHTRATEASQTLEYGARPDVIMAQVVAAFIGVRKSKIIVSPMASYIVDAIYWAISLTKSSLSSF